jgi:Ca2+-binding EF-hand superfamily protein
VLTEADFAGAEAEGPMSKGEMRAMVAVVVYFQAGEQAQVLTKDELREAIERCDGNEDGSIDRQEFAGLAAERGESLSDDARMMATLMENADPWESLVAASDEDRDGVIARTELLVFFDKHAGGEGVWDFRNSGNGEDDAAMSGPAPGTMAPDFELEPPEGGLAVRLSSYRDKLPVALIFGSYT